MRKFALILCWALLASCSLLGVSNRSPERVFASDRRITPRDLGDMAKIGFDFTQIAPSGLSYLQLLLTSPDSETAKLFQTLLSENIVSPTIRLGEGRTLLSLVLQNSGSVALEMAQALLASPHRLFYLHSSRNPLWDALENPSAEIRWKLVNLLLAEGLSLSQRDPETGNIPLLKFLSLYDGKDEALFHKVWPEVSPNLRDAKGRGVWDYLFTNPTETLRKVAGRWMKNPLYTNLLSREETPQHWPLFTLVANGHAPGVYRLTQRLKKFYAHLYSNPLWTGELLLCVLQNTGSDLRPLFLDLLSYNPDVDVKDLQGRNSFLLALSNPRSEIIPILGYLLNRHVNTEQIDLQGQGYLGYSLLNRGKVLQAILLFLDRQGLSLFGKDARGYTAMSYAVQNTGRHASQILSYLISLGIPVLPPDGQGKIPLERLLSNESSEALPMLRTLIYSSYQGKPQELYSNRVVFAAADSGSSYAYKMLLTLFQQGFNPYVTDEKRQNALFYAVRNTGKSTLPLVNLFLLKGVERNLADARGNNIFIYAVQNPIYRFVLTDLLLSWGVDMTSRNIDGKSALDVVQDLPERDQVRFREILEHHGFTAQNGSLLRLKNPSHKEDEKK